MTLEQAKMVVALAGMLLAVLGVALGNRLLVWIAMGVLGVAVVLRVVIRRTRPAPEDDASASR